MHTEYAAQRSLRMECHASLPSTNDRVRTLVMEGEAEGVIVLAERQTAGRGRQGRSFFSPEGSGLYMSLLLRPETLTAPERITVAAALATAQTLEQFSAQPVGIKWVNDVYMRGKKVAGILTEGGFDAAGKAWAALGIGVNLLPPECGFPAELASVAGAVFERGECVQRELLAAEIAKNFFHIYDAADSTACLKAYREKSILIGNTVYITYKDGEAEAQVLGIGEDFSLLVRMASGERRNLRSGEVRIRPAL